jgi:hypothetical protein
VGCFCCCQHLRNPSSVQVTGGLMHKPTTLILDRLLSSRPAIISFFQFQHRPAFSTCPRYPFRVSSTDFHIIPVGRLRSFPVLPAATTSDGVQASSAKRSTHTTRFLHLHRHGVPNQKGIYTALSRIISAGFFASTQPGAVSLHPIRLYIAVHLA